MIGEALIRGTARLLVACYGGRLCIDAAGRRDRISQQFARWLWTVGGILFLMHVAAGLPWTFGMKATQTSPTRNGYNSFPSKRIREP